MKDSKQSSGPDLTPKQEEIYRYISEFIQKKHYSPSVRDICVGVGLSSTSTVHSHVSKLEEKGYINRGDGKSRTIILTDLIPDFIKDEQPTFNEEQQPIPFESYTGTVCLPVVGNVAAGSPILAEQNITDTFTLPTAIVGDSASFLLNVRGESMIDIGINDGDYVVVKEQQVANNGDIVVALVDDGATVKRFFKEDGYFRLQPENKTMDPIIVDEVSIAGKVVALFRSLR